MSGRLHVTVNARFAWRINSKCYISKQAVKKRLLHFSTDHLVRTATDRCRINRFLLANPVQEKVVRRCLAGRRAGKIIFDCKSLLSTSGQ